MNTESRIIFHPGGTNGLIKTVARELLLEDQKNVPLALEEIQDKFLDWASYWQQLGDSLSLTPKSRKDVVIYAEQILDLAVTDSIVKSVEQQLEAEQRAVLLSGLI